jgi:hypothetical protein
MARRWKPKVSREEFCKGYAQRSCKTAEQLEAMGYYALPCDCDDCESCEGWTMQRLDFLASMLQIHRDTSSGGEDFWGGMMELLRCPDRAAMQEAMRRAEESYPEQARARLRDDGFLFAFPLDKKERGNG